MKTNICVGCAKCKEVPARVCRGEKKGSRKDGKRTACCPGFDCQDLRRLGRRWNSPIEGKREDGSGERAEGSGIGEARREFIASCFSFVR